MNGQIDLFTGAVTEHQAAPVVPVRRAVRPPLEPGQVRYAKFGGERDCDDCWQAQADAHAAGTQVPMRRRASSTRETATSAKAYLCEPHKLDRQSTDKEVEV
ncbi:hypothetical protein ACFQZ4_54140 [Catellatospora coxensis]|uniref:Uncharacterized protein n=1 Tax=Catellatospora coxensis TaxID=310354 RepID=A0A8J3L3C8_9ACTN|nr:hypothetical protein [Catellatospora coxensis]GIG11317.1 hypothetical protein Cco03nite_80170 [Catellatospora coxensis]